MIINLERKQDVGKFAFLHLGFRPFFIGASGFAILSILMWMGIYVFGWPVQIQHFAPLTWHAHEMIFGYGIAVIAGFLLTAIKNWTGKQTLHGYPLLGLFLLWLIARLLPFGGDSIPLGAIAIIDNLFILLLTFALLLPLVQAKHWKSLLILAHILLLLGSNITFYLGVAEIWSDGKHYGLYAGLYLILSLIFIMGRRVMPFFIEKGVSYPVQLRNWKWIDNIDLLVFWLFGIADLINPNAYLTAGLAALAGLIHMIRLVGWHTPGIWRNPLLWSLYLAYCFIIGGFVLKVLSIINGTSIYLAIHAFALGGVGLMTLGMMARVALGHTGRNILAPPRSLLWIFAVFIASIVIRVIFPLIDSSFYLLWIALSQFCWLVVFSWFLYIYLPILIYPRVDGYYG